VSFSYVSNFSSFGFSLYERRSVDDRYDVFGARVQLGIVRNRDGRLIVHAHLDGLGGAVAELVQET
jgi:hypothetical protein